MKRPHKNFPWGDLDPIDGYKVGDAVGIIYSDHEHYIFDNPTGEVVAVEQKSDEEFAEVFVTVQVKVSVPSSKLYKIT